MPIEANDIQFNDDAIGIGRSLRIVATGSSSVVFTRDVDFPEIIIATIDSSGGGGGGTGNGYFPQGWG